MDDRRRLLGAAACAVCLSLASGCGSSSAPKAVHLALIAPTSGATVVVSRLFVTGSVDPASARVAVGGRHTPNHRGRFGVWISVRPGLTHIRVRASAPGFLPDSMEVAVRSVPPAPVRRRDAHEAVARSLPSVEGLRAHAWTAETQTVYVNACVLNGGWQSLCECTLRYAISAGSPAQVAEGLAESRARQALPAWVRRAVAACL
jgi:hypothetical protein